MYRFASILTLGALIFLAAPAFAQEQPGVVVFSQNKCGMDQVDDVLELSEELFSPILDQKIREGKLFGYGYLTHAWGDEWNFVVYYLAPSTASFAETFSEVGRELAEEHPDFMERLATHCSEHKDNIYSVARMVGPDDVN